MPRRVILIGGAPTSGKSTIAGELSRRLGLPWISTDRIRSIMRTVATPETLPDLFNPTDDPEEFLTRYSAEEIARMEMRQGRAVWPGVRAYIRHDCIVEWVGILPELAARDFGEDASVRTVFVMDDDEERIRHVVYTRGLWDRADRYGDHLKAREVEWVRAYNRLLLADAERYGLPVVRVEKSHQDAEKVLSALGLDTMSG